MAQTNKIIRDFQYLLHSIIKGTARILLQLYLMLDRRVHIYCSNIFDGRSLMIFSNGFISCNNGDNTMENIMGDSSGKSISEIWDGERYETTRNSFRKNKIPFLSCVACTGFRVANKEKLSFSKTRFPYNIFIETTALCNLHCYICKREKIKKDRGGKLIFELEKLKSVLNEIISQKETIRFINWFGFGEPFTDKNLMTYIKVIKNEAPGIKHKISTNGILLDSDSKIENLLKLGVDKISFSIDGASEESYGKYRRGGNFPKALSNMKNLIRLRNESEYQKPFINWQYIFFKWNDSNEEIEMAQKLSKKIGVDQLEFKSTYSPILYISRKYPPFAKMKLKKLNDITMHYLKL
jgi:wyosine [tRNA(Phe)-imidazoG37] synthetase (radical SAM superfamily)